MLDRCDRFEESDCLGVQSKIGGKFHLKLNTEERPIANKYREGKMQRTLKRESKVLEIVKREAIRISHCSAFNLRGASYATTRIAGLDDAAMVAVVWAGG